MEAAVAAAERAKETWRKYPAGERGKLMFGLAQKMRENRDRMAEIDGSIAYFEFYASLVYVPTGGNDATE